MAGGSGAPSRTAAAKAQWDLERHRGVPIPQLRRVDGHGRDGTVLPRRAKVYVPAPRMTHRRPDHEDLVSSWIYSEVVPGSASGRPAAPALPQDRLPRVHLAARTGARERSPPALPRARSRPSRSGSHLVHAQQRPILTAHAEAQHRAPQRAAAAAGSLTASVTPAKRPGGGDPPRPPRPTPAPRAVGLRAVERHDRPAHVRRVQVRARDVGRSICHTTRTPSSSARSCAPSRSSKSKITMYPPSLPYASGSGRPPCPARSARPPHYMQENVTYPQLRLNLLGKMDDTDFRADPASPVLDLPEGYDIDFAADTLMERIGVLLRNAPPLEHSRWRVA